MITIQGKKVKPAFVSLEDAFQNGTERDLVNAMIIKLTHSIDNCDSSRDLRPLMNGMFEALDRLKAIDAAASVEDETNETPLASVLRMAQ